jgi:hypothetical protein
LGQIFISYRRSDTSGHAGRLRDRLRAHFGEDVVFQDVDNIPDGEEFAKVIERALDSCKVALVVIGRNWVNAQSTRGVRRFDDPDDWVRTEVGILLRRGIRVVPVLVQGAALPRREDLPEELKDLAGRNARELRDSAWDADMSLLLRSLEPVIGSRRKRNIAIAVGVAGLLLIGTYVIPTGWFDNVRHRPGPQPSATGSMASVPKGDAGAGAPGEYVPTPPKGKLKLSASDDRVRAAADEIGLEGVWVNDKTKEGHIFKPTRAGGMEFVRVEPPQPAGRTPERVEEITWHDNGPQAWDQDIRITVTWDGAIGQTKRTFALTPDERLLDCIETTVFSASTEHVRCYDSFQKRFAKP